MPAVTKVPGHGEVEAAAKHTAHARRSSAPRRVEDWAATPGQPALSIRVEDEVESMRLLLLFLLNRLVDSIELLLLY